jgi:hypothetical protein
MSGVFALLKHLPTIIPLVIEAVKAAEKLFGSKKGELKKEYVVNLVKVAILSVEGISQKDIVDENLFSEGVGDIVDGVVKVLNSTKKFNADAVAVAP